jgi:sugar O-acyltransferase (sialic acid O-acetyltransferase NeuD family)
MAKVVVFGIQDSASLAHFYLTHDSEHQVVAFSVTQEYLPKEATFEGLPIIPFEEVGQTWSPAQADFFAPMSSRDMNRPRASIYNAIKAKGYRLISYVSSKATVSLGTPVGDNCFIMEDSTIHPFTRIGNDVVLRGGNGIGHHSVIKDHVMFAPHVLLGGHCVVEPYCVVGANATIREGTHIAEGSFIAMGACVTRDTEPWGVYRGTPAQRV